MLLFCVSEFGCGTREKISRVQLAGTVTLNRALVKNGTIIAIPAVSSTGTGQPKVTNAIATITDGRYEFRKDSGPGPSSYLFEIYLFTLKARGPKAASDSSPVELETVGEEMLFRQDVTIPKEGSKAFTVELKTSDRVTGKR